MRYGDIIQLPMHYSPLMQSQCALTFVVGGAYGASPRVYLVRYLGSRHLAVCVEVEEATVVSAASPTSPCAAARPMAGGGPRSRNPIHRLFAWLSHIWSLLNSIADKLQGVVDKLQRVERALETPAPKGLNPDAWVGLRPASAKAYSDAVQAFVAFVEKQRPRLNFPQKSIVLLSFMAVRRVGRGHRWKLWWQPSSAGAQV